MLSLNATITVKKHSCISAIDERLAETRSSSSHKRLLKGDYNVVLKI